MKDRPCRYCLGARCTSCNGTGIDGDPRILFAILIIVMFTVLAALGVGLYELFT